MRIVLAWLVLAACSDHKTSDQPPPPLPTAPAVPAAVPAPIVARGSISAGRAHVCVRTSDAKAACWGLMSSTMAELVPTPTRVTGPEHVVGVATSDFEDCAWTTEGAVWCWGLVGPDRAAHAIPKLAEVVEVTGDSSMMCARTRRGGVTCWSRDVTGEGGAAKPLVLHEAAELRDAVQLAVAGSHACARRTGGEVACWEGSAGKPATLPAAAGATAIFGGSAKRYSSAPTELFAAILPGGKLVGWNGARQAWALPALPAEVTRIGIGSEEACALGHGVTCWDLEKPNAAAKPRAGLDGAVDLAIGESVSCVRTSAAQAMCWGIPDRVGNGVTLLTKTPSDVVGLDDAVQISTGLATCARKKTGAVACWGGPLVGETAASRATDVPGITDAVEIAVGDAYACARRANSDVTCWGAKDDKGKARWPTPTAVPELAHATGLVVVYGDVCAMRKGHTICPKQIERGPGIPADVTREWASSIARDSWECVEIASQPKIVCHQAFAGRHGDDSGDEVDTELGELTDVTDLVLPRDDVVFYVARKNGDLGYHGMGDGDGVFHAIPVGGKVRSIVSGPGGPDADGGPIETCGLLASGSVACWTDPDPVKVREVAGITDATQLVGSRAALGFSVLCALRKTGKVACWGARAALGDGVGTGSDAPVVINGLAL